MDLYYKVLIDSKIGKSFIEIYDKYKKYQDKCKEISKKYDIKEMYSMGWDLANVYTCHFNNTPDRNDWKKCRDGYMPKVTSKNKELLKDFQELKVMSIEGRPIEDLLKLDNPFFHVGYHIFDDCIVFFADDKNKIKIKDAIMISNLDYLALKDKDSSKCL